MRFSNSFDVQAAPERVYSFLLDVTEVIPCVPGAELTEVLDGETYRGRVKIKIGAIVMSYNGTATIAERDDETRSATLRAEGRETSGSGAATMKATLAVAPAPSGSAVTIDTDLVITGRAAQFGRGIVEDISKRLIGQMADSIKERLERPVQTPSAQDGPGDAPSAQDGPGDASSAQDGPGDALGPAQHASPQPERSPATQAAPVNALALLFSVLRERIARLFRRGRRTPP